MKMHVKASTTISAQTQESYHSTDFEKSFFQREGTYVHPTAIVGPNVHLAPNVKIGPFCVLLGSISIGEGTRLFSHVTVGFPAQNIGTFHSLGTITIGARCEIREFVTISAPKIADGTTQIGDNCYIMNYAHIGHDVTLENNVTLINSVNIGGHAHIGSNVVLMASSAVHQWCRIGRYSCVTPYSGARQDLPPFCKFEGQPGHFAGLNLIALKRALLSPTSIDALKSVTKLFYQDKKLLALIQEEAAFAAWGSDQYVHEFLQFVAHSERGVSRRNIADMQHRSSE